MKNTNSWSNSELINLKNNKFLEGYRIAGAVAAGALNLLETLIKEKTQLTMLELDKIAEEYILERDSYDSRDRGYPNTTCISLNTTLVHGIPTNYKLKPGDLVSVDLGTFQGKFIGDCAKTLVYSEYKDPLHEKLVRATKEALKAGIETIKIDQKIGVIGAAIYKSAKGNGFEVINSYGGHGIDIAVPHAQPFIANKSTKFDGQRICAGMSIAIEPLLIIGNSTKTKVNSNKWNVECDSICGHEEVSVFINENGVEIVT